MKTLDELKEILERCEKDKAHTNGEWRGEYERCTQNRRFCDTSRTDLPRVTEFAIKFIRNMNYLWEQGQLNLSPSCECETMDEHVEHIWSGAGKDAGQ